MQRPTPINVGSLDEVKKEFKFECFSYFSMFASPSGNQIIRVTQEGYNPPKNF